MRSKKAGLIKGRLFRFYSYATFRILLETMRYAPNSITSMHVTSPRIHGGTCMSYAPIVRKSTPTHIAAVACISSRSFFPCACCFSRARIFAG